MAEAVDGDGRNAGAGAAPPERIVDRRVEDPFILADKDRLVLRQIYTARMIWFGMVDMFILTCFCMTIRGKLGLATVELFVQFLFPLLVAVVFDTIILP